MALPQRAQRGMTSATEGGRRAVDTANTTQGGLPVSQFAGSVATHIPYRLLYPTSEYSYNSTNVNAQGTINNMTSTIFWMP